MNKKFLFMAACCCGGQALNAAVVPYVTPAAAFPRSAYKDTPLNVPYSSRIDIDALTVEGTVVVTDNSDRVRTSYRNKAYCELDIYRPMAFDLPDELQLTYSLRQILDLYKTPQAFTTFFSQLAFETASQVIAICEWFSESGKDSIFPRQIYGSPNDPQVICMLLKGPDINEIDQLLSEVSKPLAAKQSTFLVRDSRSNLYGSTWANENINCYDYALLYQTFTKKYPTLDESARPGLMAQIVKDFPLYASRSFLNDQIESMEEKEQHGWDVDYTSTWLPLARKAAALLDEIEQGQSKYHLVIVPCPKTNQAACADYANCIRSDLISAAAKDKKFPITLELKSQGIKVKTPIFPIKSRNFGEADVRCFVVIAQGEPEPIKVDQPNNDNQ